MFTVENGSKVTILSGVLPQAVRERQLERRFNPVIESFIERYEWAPEHARELIESFRAGDPDFSFSGLMRAIAKISEAQTARLGKGPVASVTRETITSSQTVAAINMIVTNTIFNDYGDQSAIYQDLAEIEVSNGDSELYPEEWADDMPVPVAETEPAPETRIGSGVIRIQNYVYARALAISKRYFDKDKTGQVRRVAANFGKKYKKAMDKSFVTAFFRAGTVANLIANGGYIPSTNIAGQNAYTVGGSTYYNPSAGPVSPDRLEAALTAPAQFSDPYGNLIEVDMNTVFVDTFDRMRVKRYLTSQYTPNQPTVDVGGQAAGTFAENPLRDEFQIAFSPYVKQARAPISGTGFPWATLEAKRGAVMQIVQDLQVLQEAALAGKSFDERSYRWTCSAEWGTGVRNARLLYFGN